MVGFCYFRSEANVPTYPFYNIKRRRGSEEGSRGGFVLEFYHALVLRSTQCLLDLTLSENAVQSISRTRHSLSQTVAGSGLYFLCMSCASNHAYMLNGLSASDSLSFRRLSIVSCRLGVVSSLCLSIQSS